MSTKKTNAKNKIHKKLSSLIAIKMKTTKGKSGVDKNDLEKENVMKKNNTVVN